MKLDIDFSEIDINNLDFENVGSWPKPVKVIATTILVVAVMIGGFFLLVDSKIKTLDEEQSKEVTLKQIYQAKFAAAANLELYVQQMNDMEELFAALLKRLPASHETPGLLDDITNVGTSSGLIFLGINWLPEISKEFYTELPITIEVVGSFHEFGEFVSKVAQLPRIVTLHDFKITQLADGRLNLNIVAKTYRYKPQVDQTEDAQ